MGKNVNHTERMTIRLTQEQAEALEEIVLEGGQESRSWAIRDAIDEYIEAHRQPMDAARVSVRIPSRVSEELDKLVLDGTILSREEGMRIALRRFIKEESDYFLNRTRQYDQQRVESLQRSMESLRDLQP